MISPILLAILKAYVLESGWKAYLVGASELDLVGQRA